MQPGTARDQARYRGHAGIAPEHRRTRVSRQAVRTACATALLAILATAGAGEPPPAAPPEVTAQQLIEGALDLTRGINSYSELAMIIHRPDWERRLELQVWTRGREDALIRFTAPAKDAGTATLKLDERMWSYTPRHKREFRLPKSMMSQSWAGSDFSYNDLSRTDQYLRHYDYAIVGTEQQGEHRVYTLELVPHDDAPVVWGKETMELREDYVLLRQTFYDQALKPLKELRAVEVGELGGRTIATVTRMADFEQPEKWTEVHYQNADFESEVDDGRFTLFALRGER